MTTTFVEFLPSGKRAKHGGAGTTYSSHGCRCTECKLANARRVSIRRNSRLQEEGSFQHGNSAYVNWGCRCPVCSEAHSEYCKAYYRKNKEKK